MIEFHTFQSQKTKDGLLGDNWLHERRILKQMLKIMAYEVMGCGSVQDPVTSTCEHVKKTLRVSHYTWSNVLAIFVNVRLTFVCAPWNQSVGIYTNLSFPFPHSKIRLYMNAISCIQQDNRCVQAQISKCVDTS